jgi:caffeoyl-CoA O-methyltransferase
MVNYSDTGKFIPLTDNVYDYVLAHRSNAHDEVLEALRAETATLGGISEMLIPREQGSFMTMLVAATGAKRALEIGTFTGYSAICIARGLPADGKLICCDISEEWTSIARRHWPRAGVENKIELRLGPAQSTLEAMSPDEEFDIAFIDADKSGYDNYFELVLPRLRSNGLILFDNMLRRGKVVGENLTGEDAAIDTLNTKLANDSRVDSVLLPLADGVMMCRKK